MLFFGLLTRPDALYPIVRRTPSAPLRLSTTQINLPALSVSADGEGFFYQTGRLLEVSGMRSLGGRKSSVAQGMSRCVSPSSRHKTFILKDIHAQVTYNGEERFGEVHFFYRISVEEDKWRPVALISLYSAPDPTLLKTSSNTLLVCRYHGDDSLVLIEANTVKSVVAMVPFMERSEGDRPRHRNGRFFVVEKPGLSLAELGMEEGLELS